MMRRTMAAGLLLALAACGQWAQRPPAPQNPAPAPIACNDVAVNPAVSVSPTGAVSAASSAAALLGGPINPGLYDLVRVEQRGGATDWAEQVWQSARVADSEAGQVIDFALARGSATAEPERYTARVAEEPEAALVYTCGREGQAPLSWAAPSGELQLLLPAESGTGQTLHVFTRRAG